MSKELSSVSNISDLVDYLLEIGASIYISPIPTRTDPSLRIQVDCTGAHGEPIRCVKRIDVDQYKNAISEVRNMVVTQTVYTLIEELTRQGDKHDQI